jgi:hypothetical protein
MNFEVKDRASGSATYRRAVRPSDALKQCCCDFVTAFLLAPAHRRRKLCCLPSLPPRATQWQRRPADGGRCVQPPNVVVVVLVLDGDVTAGLLLRATMARCEVTWRRCAKPVSIAWSAGCRRPLLR